MTDLSALEAIDTATLDVDAPNGDPLLFNGAPVRITVYGPGSAAYTRAQAKMDAANQSRTFAALRGKPLKESPDELRRARAEKLAACTVRIDGIPDADPLEIYSNPRLSYIANQVERFIEDWANFLPGSATT